MTRETRRCAAALSVLLLVLYGATRWAAAGDLNPPPGPIAPAMKTLEQVEPRIVVHDDLRRLAESHMAKAPPRQRLQATALVDQA